MDLISFILVYFFSKTHTAPIAAHGFSNLPGHLPQRKVPVEPLTLIYSPPTSQIVYESKEKTPAISASFLNFFP
jgi:hypothetical protein